MSKTTTLEEAVKQFVQSESIIYIAGFTHLIPFAAGHEIIRQRISNLTLARTSLDIIADQLVAAGLIRKLIFGYAGNPGVGPLRCIQRQIEQGKLEIEEYTTFGMIARLRAAAEGLPFMLMQQSNGKDLEKLNPNYRTIIDPYTNQKVTTLPPLIPDVSIVHVQRSDENGNAQIWGIIGEQKEAAFASKHVIITTEEIVSEDVIRSDPNRTIIPGIIVDAVCHVPYACHPSYAQSYYDRDNLFYNNWNELSHHPEEVQKYLNDWVYNIKDRQDYWKKLSPNVRNRLQVKDKFMPPANNEAKPKNI